MTPRSPRPWTEDEIEWLREAYPLGGVSLVQTRLPHRTQGAIWMKCSDLNIPAPPARPRVVKPERPDPLRDIKIVEPGVDPEQRETVPAPKAAPAAARAATTTGAVVKTPPQTRAEKHNTDDGGPAAPTSAQEPAKPEYRRCPVPGCTIRTVGGVVCTWHERGWAPTEAPQPTGSATPDLDLPAFDMPPGVDLVIADLDVNAGTAIVRLGRSGQVVEIRAAGPETRVTLVDAGVDDPNTLRPDEAWLIGNSLLLGGQVASALAQTPRNRLAEALLSAVVKLQSRPEAAGETR